VPTSTSSRIPTVAKRLNLAGARDPRLVAAYVTLVAAPGDEGALQRGIDLCDEALLSRGGSTDDGWVALGAKRSQLAGRLARIRATAGIDEHGNAVFIRRHHPDDPRRSPRHRGFDLDG
jgi:hypothetical protein